ncbi:uncharacterized protein B0I36DRAFT_350830 [Microdochium trichocladiopsis]|uniref:Rhodopsin domain-containing protein n=1 Tax=Microdochium trichocladiopsis TaxID=1682393 RepID=A0A9P8Y003_9PEZI|nr:uncharacterized protein B0I36DRAFT_350830 [Microdochium trichocladiopsis]KAH7027268.1 hypothetical protein B0I36DRAFT_350830 [Microdochium trichocladiopsis]
MAPASAAFLAANCVVQAVVLTVVMMRFYSRVTTSSLGWDDWWVLIATGLSCCSLTTAICFDVLGSGYLVQEVAINLSTIYLLIFIIQPLFLFTIAATKVSVCCFYLRVFVGRGMRIATCCTIALVSAWAVAHFIAAVFICTPVAGAYDLRLAAIVKCGDQSKFFQSGLSINVVLDAIVIALPLWTIWNLNMRTSDKVGLSIAFSIGIGMIVVGIIRAIYVVRTSLTGDVTATLPTNLFLTVFEQQLAIITISIPMLRPLWARYRNRATGYNLDGEQAGGGKHSGTGTGEGSELATFGGSGGKKSNNSRNVEAKSERSSKRFERGH